MKLKRAYCLTKPEANFGPQHKISKIHNHKQSQFRW